MMREARGIEAHSMRNTPLSSMIRYHPQYSPAVSSIHTEQMKWAAKHVQTYVGMDMCYHMLCQITEAQYTAECQPTWSDWVN